MGQMADSDLMLARRIRRDIAERGRDVEGVLTQVSRRRCNFLERVSHWEIVRVQVSSSDHLLVYAMIVFEIRQE